MDSSESSGGGLMTDERTAFRSGRRAKYGTDGSRLGVHRGPPSGHIEHTLEPTDTLAGLSLKYSTTSEAIRRANGLYANNSIHVLPTLRIPFWTRRGKDALSAQASGEDIDVDEGGEGEGEGEGDAEGEGARAPSAVDFLASFDLKFNAVKQRVQETGTSLALPTPVHVAHLSRDYAVRSSHENLALPDDQDLFGL